MLDNQLSFFLQIIDLATLLLKDVHFLHETVVLSLKGADEELEGLRSSACGPPSSARLTIGAGARSIHTFQS